MSLLSLVTFLLSISAGLSEHEVAPGQSASQYHHQAPLSLLHDLIIGEVIPCCGPRYDELRSVNNRACVSRPEVIVRPATTEDVAIAVNFARRNGLKVDVYWNFLNIFSLSIQFSVRSGGHSYTCTNIRDGGLHVDLRR